ncbi:MAG: hypothetical protein ABJJ09_03110 [Ascidiaceihabitans sp.]|uniref:hypothetical protein n=1 Tax=Ascidiaceihabitans sp. TaxID=1872644 RepID=UPI0032988C9A
MNVTYHCALWCTVPSGGVLCERFEVKRPCGHQDFVTVFLYEVTIIWKMYRAFGDNEWIGQMGCRASSRLWKRVPLQLLVSG